MRIDGPLSVPDNLQPDKLTRPGSSTQQNHPVPADSSQDQAQLSVSNQTLEQLKAALSQVPEVRQDRVDALRQAVSSGTYNVSDQQLSDAIASDMLVRVIA